MHSYSPVRFEVSVLLIPFQGQQYKLSNHLFFSFLKTKQPFSPSVFLLSIYYYLSSISIYLPFKLLPRHLKH